MEFFQDSPQNFGALLLAALTVLVIILQKSVPTIILFIKRLQKTHEKRSEIEEKSKEHEANLSLSAKEYLSRIAQESIESHKKEVQRLADEIKKINSMYHTSQIELAELKTKDNIRLQLIIELQNELEENKESIKDIPNMQIRLATFETQIKQLESVIDMLKKDKDRLEQQLAIQRSDVAEKEKTILLLESKKAILEQKITELESLNIQYRMEIERYRGREEK